MRAFVKYHLPVILYSAVILGVSSIPNLKSPEIRFLATDKVAHFLEYAAFALLAFRSMSRLGSLTHPKLPFLLSVISLVLFAVVDEVLQGFVPGRRPDLWDYLADLSGGLTLLTFLWFWKRRKANPKP